LLLRYTDNNSYYEVEFKPNGKKNNFHFISEIDGTYKVIESVTVEFQFEKWFRIQVIFKQRKSFYFLQLENIRENTDELFRGTIGFGVIGNNALFIGGNKIDEVLISRELIIIF